MGTHTEPPAIALVHALAQPAEKPLTRTQSRIVHYLVKQGYVLPHGLSRRGFRALAEHYGVSVSLIRHQMQPLVKMGAVASWRGEDGQSQFAFDPEWQGCTTPTEDEES